MIQIKKVKGQINGQVGGHAAAKVFNQVKTPIRNYIWTRLLNVGVVGDQVCGHVSEEIRLMNDSITKNYEKFKK